jgi:hypothetical protein
MGFGGTTDDHYYAGPFFYRYLAGSFPVLAGSLPVLAGSCRFLPVLCRFLPVLCRFFAGSLPVLAGSLPVLAGVHVLGHFIFGSFPALETQRGHFSGQFHAQTRQTR